MLLRVVFLVRTEVTACDSDWSVFTLKEFSHSKGTLEL